MSVLKACARRCALRSWIIVYGFLIFIVSMPMMCGKNGRCFECFVFSATYIEDCVVFSPAMDLFESALELEEHHLQEGFQDGIAAGRAAGIQDGKALGLQKGFEIGHEIGFYSGSIQIWRKIDEKNPGFINERAEKAISSLDDAITDFPTKNPRDEHLQDKMDTVRGRFKVATTLLGIQNAYDAHKNNTGTATNTSRLMPPQEVLQF